MTILDTEKRPRGLKALTAFKPNGLKSSQKKSPDPPSPQDDPVDVPDFLTADTLPPIPGQGDKQLPQPPAPPLNNIARREAPAPVVQPVAPAQPPSSKNMNTRPRNGMPMDSMPMNTVPVPGPAPTSPPPQPADRPVNMKPIRNPGMSMDQAPHGDFHAATVPHAPKPIRPPSIPVVDRVPSVTRSPPPNGTATPNDEAPALNGLIAEDKDTTGNVTPVANHAAKGRDQEEEGEEEETRGTATPLVPADVPAVAAPLNDIHFNCYQDHRAMRMANNIWYPVPCMACHKHDQEIRRRCVFCCLRVCNGCFQVLQRCQRRSLRELLDGIEVQSSHS